MSKVAFRGWLVSAVVSDGWAREDAQRPHHAGSLCMHHAHRQSRIRLKRSLHIMCVLGCAELFTVFLHVGEFCALRSVPLCVRFCLCDVQKKLDMLHLPVVSEI
jgi:hypothetical protein